MLLKYEQKSDLMIKASNLKLFQAAEESGFIKSINYIAIKRIS